MKKYVNYLEVKYYWIAIDHYYGKSISSSSVSQHGEIGLVKCYYHNPIFIKNILC